MNAFTQLLLLISNGLLIPVIVLLLGLFAATIVYLGGLLAEACTRWRHRAFRRYVRQIQRRRGIPVSRHAIPAPYGLAVGVLRQVASAPQASEKIMDDAQLLAERLLARLSIGVRIGPVLGLTGTLIPLGPALLSLSSGDVATLSTKLAVAFTTTVLGLVIGGTCAVMHSIRKSWYMQDLSDIQYLLDHMEFPHE